MGFHLHFVDMALAPLTRALPSPLCENWQILSQLKLYDRNFVAAILAVKINIQEYNKKSTLGVRTCIKTHQFASFYSLEQTFVTMAIMHQQGKEFFLRTFLIKPPFLSSVYLLHVKQVKHQVICHRLPKCQRWHQNRTNEKHNMMASSVPLVIKQEVLAMDSGKNLFFFFLFWTSFSLCQSSQIHLFIIITCNVYLCKTGSKITSIFDDGL